MPTFNGEGLVPAVAPGDLMALPMVNVSSSDSSGSDEEEEEEGEGEFDSEATGEESEKSFPRRRSRTLCSMSDDDETSAGRGGVDSPPVPRKDRSGLVPPGSALAPGRSEASFDLPDASSASMPPKADPSCRLSGFKFRRKLLESVNDDQ